MKSTIVVCCHKPGIWRLDETYFPLHVGRSLSNRTLDIPGDDTGDNISFKNREYCELTGLYWAWKNLPEEVDIVGLAHYRRYLDFHNQADKFYSQTYRPESFIKTGNFSIPSEILEFVCKGGVILPKPTIFRISVGLSYCSVQNSADLRALEKVVRNTGDQFSKAWDDCIVKSNRLHPCNMFLFNHSTFNSCCQWLFYVLNEVENVVDTSNYDGYMKRIYGFMGEMLIPLWVKAQKLKVKTCPIISVVDNPNYPTSQFKTWIRNIAAQMVFNLTVPPKYWHL